MTALARLLHDRIAADGPIGVDLFMALCLGHPEHGYYRKQDPLGAKGDFTTAPEVSQMFGEMIGLWLAETWDALGRPDPVALVELGPGRGTLMADILRVARAVPGFAEAVQVHLVETSPALRARQKEALGDRQVRWHDHVETLPDMPLLLVANEFFDALPIRQFQKTDLGWQERRIASDGVSFRFTLGPAVQQDPALLIEPEGRILETCPAGEAIAANTGARIAAQGGAALWIDYGAEDGLGDTLQALRDHKPEPVFAHPGDADLTAHVRFKPLAAAAAPARATPVTTQGHFLERLGITARAQALAAARPDRSAAIASEHRRLTHPAEMGNLFKVQAVTSLAPDRLAGFAP
ncbi:class I SAM-dependent methyltransferase [Oceanomicrobium pacificus]|uniref:Class I SAM-dependent methyltransferase n=1 Tax=Oceanomicrobium pacificus TaxID=2692916 RepID=A0A6B0TIM5_9RHOB|nr:SAM-dependent methyltransferase [Oceanomicrobium pacificus]MXU64217.1 class I SAM-dependent methyltransferase [Oceanomicrobium pacificus]